MARITPEACRRCLACVASCPCGAVQVKDATPMVHPELCRGCGVCAAGCPSLAIDLSRSSEAEFAVLIKAAAAGKVRRGLE